MDRIVAELFSNGLIMVAMIIGDRGHIQQVLISLIWHKRAIPLYWQLLDKRGSSNTPQYITSLTRYPIDRLKHPASNGTLKTQVLFLSVTPADKTSAQLIKHLFLSR